MTKLPNAQLTLLGNLITMLRRSFIQSLKRVEDALSTVGLRSLSCCPRQVAGSQLHFNASSGSSVDSAGMKIVRATILMI